MASLVGKWWRYRGTRVITCPENHQPAAVRVALFSGDPRTTLKTCSRWPEKEGCDQACVAELEQSPEKCLVQAIASDWYTGKRCIYCQELIGDIVWHERPPALRAEDGSMREWKDVAPQDLPVLLATHQPVCWRCFVAESFRIQHPEWVIERPRGAEGHETLQPSAAVY
ncbi:MAG TPA: hypothetical protein VLV78_18965 [Thermoanaerobaculia bacterium]|nr:hypothetical protein [Thermoanaerobaculia bacterium]